MQRYIKSTYWQNLFFSASFFCSPNPLSRRSHRTENTLSRKPPTILCPTTTRSKAPSATPTPLFRHTSTGCCPLVVRLMSACCPLLKRTTSGHQADNKRTTTGVGPILKAPGNSQNTTMNATVPIATGTAALAYYLKELLSDILAISCISTIHNWCSACSRRCRRQFSGRSRGTPRRWWCRL